MLVDTGARGVVPGAGKLTDHLARRRRRATRYRCRRAVARAYGDHIAGNLSDGGVPAFANARYVMFEEEWDFWMSNPSLEELPIDPATRQNVAAFVRTNLAGIEAQLRLVESETEILPGISALRAFGHTPGHMSLEIASGGRALPVRRRRHHRSHPGRTSRGPRDQRPSTGRDAANSASYPRPSGEDKSARVGLAFSFSGCRLCRGERTRVAMATRVTGTALQTVNTLSGVSPASSNKTTLDGIK